MCHLDSRRAATRMMASALSRQGIDEANRRLLRRYREFRCAADAVAAAWRRHRHVVAVSLIGSAARAPFREVPRFAPYRRARIELWHECKDVDLALWLVETTQLNRLRRAKAKALRELFERDAVGVASHQVDVFVLEAGTDRYLGRLCDFNTCPKGKPECRVPECGRVEFLRQHDGFAWRRDAISAENAVRLFDRTAHFHRRAVDLPLPAAR